MNKKALLALLILKGPILCVGCGKEIKIKKVIDKRKHYLLLKGGESGRTYDNRYFIYNMKTNKILSPGSFSVKSKYWPVKEDE